MAHHRIPTDGPISYSKLTDVFVHASLLVSIDRLMVMKSALLPRPNGQLDLSKFKLEKGEDLVAPATS